MTASLSGLIPEMQELAKQLDNVVHASGLQGRITSTLRTHAEQKRLYDRYLRGEAEFPAAPPGMSAHEYGWAFDYVVSPWEYQGDVGAFWKDNGLVWSPKDAVHFEYPGFSPPAGAGDESKPLSFWDYAGWAMSTTSLISALFELGYIVASRQEAEKVARAIGIDPNAPVF